MQNLSHLPNIDLPSMPSLPDIDPSDVIDQAGRTVRRAGRSLPWVDDRSTWRRLAGPALLALAATALVVLVVKRRRNDTSSVLSSVDGDVRTAA